MGNNNNRKKNKLRSALTGRIINGREVILVEEAIEYIKKMGYIVERPFFKIVEKAIGFMFLFVILFPLISAAPDLFIMDFSLTYNQVFMVLLFAIAIVIYVFRNYLFSGTLILIGGMLMAFNSINLIFSLLVISVGILILTQEGKT